MLPPFPAKVPLAQLPTPFRPLDRISRSLGGPRIWIKCDDMSGSVLSGNKVRKLEFICARALSEGCQVLITCGGIQSNHCRATAIAAAQLGMDTHLLLRGSAEESQHADGNLLLDRLAGATVSIYSPRDYFAQLQTLLENWREHYAQQGKKAWVIPTGASDAHGLWGYLAATRELREDFKRHSIQPELVVCATGSGGTQSGLTLGFALQGLATNVLGMAVCDSEEYFAHKAKQDIKEWSEFLPRDFLVANHRTLHRLEVSTCADYIGPGYGIGYEGVYDTIRWLAKEEGVILDPVYTGKAFFGLISEIKAGRLKHVKNVVFIHTGGVFGLFPAREALLAGMNGDGGE